MSKFRAHEAGLTECVILLRLPNGEVTAVGADRADSQLLVFNDRYQAIAFALRQRFSKTLQYQIVELDELLEEERPLLGPANDPRRPANDNNKAGSGKGK